MDLKNLMDQVVRPVNPTTTGELPAPELAELSEEDLQQIRGGITWEMAQGGWPKPKPTLCCDHDGNCWVC
jgi:bacteriocin leader peptide (microcyclamide/patellamide family)